MRRSAAALVAATLALTLLPGVPAAPDPAAPAATAAFPETPDPIPPFGYPEEIELAVTYDCSRQHPTEATRIAFDVVEAPDWLTATPENPEILDRVNRTRCAEQDLRRTVRSTWSLGADPDAPAHRPANFTVEATVTLADGTHTARATTPVEAGFYGIIAAETPRTMVRTEVGENATVPLEVVNMGNGPVEATIRAVDLPDAVTLDPPDPHVIPASGQDAPPTWEATVGVRSEEPNAQHRIDLEVAARDAADPSVAGDRVEVSILLETSGPAITPSEGSLEPVTSIPAFTAGFVATMGLGAALLRRRG